MRAAEATAFASGTSQTTLMACAGLAVAREVHRHASGRPILVLAGPGNNGGDAYVAARTLAEWGHDVMVAKLGEPTNGAARAAFDAWKGPCAELADAIARPVLVDGLFGIGLDRPLAGEVASALARLAGHAELVVAIDLPSGIATDSGKSLGASHAATVTVALAALKPAHLLGEGAVLSGRVRLADLGIERTNEWTTLARPGPLAPPRDTHKYRRGLVLVIGGAMPGAARLAARAAARAGAGYVWLATEHGEAAGIDAIVAQRLPQPSDLEALMADGRIDAVLIGPGLGRDDRAIAILERALDIEAPLVVDGDALSLLAGRAGDIARRAAPTVLTPHSGEFDRLFGESSKPKIARTLETARASGATVIHKGHDTVIADTSGRVIVSACAPVTLSTAGSGDILAGLTVGRLAAGDDVAANGAPATAAWLHARSAELAGPGLVADDLADHVAKAVAEIW